MSQPAPVKQDTHELGRVTVCPPHRPSPFASRSSHLGQATTLFPLLIELTDHYHLRSNTRLAKPLDMFGLCREPRTVSRGGNYTAARMTGGAAQRSSTAAGNVGKRLLIVLVPACLVAACGVAAEVAFGDADVMAATRSWLLPTVIAAAAVTTALEAPKVTVQLQAAAVELTEVKHQLVSRQPQRPGTITASLGAGSHRYTFEDVAVTPHQDSRYQFLDVRRQGISPAEYASLCRALADPDTPTGWHMALGISGQLFNFEDCEVTPNAPASRDYYLDVRAHTDETQHRQVLEALAETTNPLA